MERLQTLLHTLPEPAKRHVFGLVDAVARGEPATILALCAGVLVLYALVAPTRRVRALGKAVVITGCDHGLGQMLALQSASKGFTVFAGCLTDPGAELLKSRAPQGGASIIAFKMDVTSSSSIAAAAAFVRAHPLCQGHIHAVVNNAGIGLAGPVDWMPMTDYRRTLDVNFFGAVEVTKAFMGLLTAVDPADGRRGRVINISSVAGLIGVPGLSAYCASKFALEGFSDALRREMAPWRVPVVLIEPSFLNTPIIHGAEGNLQRQWAALSPEVKERWGQDYLEVRKATAERVKDEAEAPQLGVDAMMEALTAATPAVRYKAGWRAKTLYGPLSLLPGALLDWLLHVATNEGPASLPAGCKAKQE